MLGPTRRITCCCWGLTCPGVVLETLRLLAISASPSSEFDCLFKPCAKISRECNESAGLSGWAKNIYASNSLRGNSDCRIIDRKGPIRISAWLGTGTVMVRSGSRRCITIWLPRCRISKNPCRDKIAHTSLPERMSSLPNGNLNLRDKYISMKSVLYFFTRCRFKE